MSKFVIAQGGIPAGTYTAKFTGIEPTNHVEYGKGICFQFEIKDGPSAGRKATRITSAEPTPGNVAGRMLAGLTGNPLKVKDQVDVTQYVGRDYQILVEEVKEGKTRIGKVTPIPAN